MKFEENWSRGFREEVIHRCGQTEGQMDEVQQVITIALILYIIFLFLLKNMCWWHLLQA